MVRDFNFLEYFLVFVSTVSGCVSVSAFRSLVGVSVGIGSSALGLKICASNAGIKKYNSIIKEKKKKHNNIVLLAKSKLNTVKVLISKGLINFYINNE